jgi:hypothetical protein
MKLFVLIVFLVGVGYIGESIVGMNTAVPVAEALSDWDSSCQDETSDGGAPDELDANHAVWNAEWDSCTDCTDNSPTPPATHFMWIDVDDVDLECPSGPVQAVLAELFIQFCAPMGGLSSETVIGEVGWFHDSDELARTDLKYAYTVGGGDPYSVAYAEVTCNDVEKIYESETPNRMFVQWHQNGQATPTPSKGNAPRGWELHITCCDV